MSFSSKALKYAEALADVAAESANAAEAGRDLESFRDLLAGSDELMTALHNPAIPFSAKRTIVEQVGSRAQLSSLVINLVLVMLENGRIRLVDEVAEAYQAVMDERSGVVAVEVSSARPLSEENRQRLTEVLRQVTASEVSCRFHVDETLVGGMKMQIGSKVFDGTVSTRLEQLRAAIIGGR